jgi:DNA-binding response OmpR family regulator
MDYRILIAEDEPQLREILCDYFRSKGDTPVEAANGTRALELAEDEDYDAVLLDIMMPGLDGFGVCRALRRKSDVPILFLTALSDEEDKLHGYELGADDYVTKPFTLSVLYAKTAALIKRNRGNMLMGDRLEAGKITLELSSHKVFLNKAEIQLTPKEYALLLCLMKNRNMVLSREQLLVKCWGYDYDGDTRAVDTHIKRLREKLGKHADCIKTVIKAGYKLEVHREEA